MTDATTAADASSATDANSTTNTSGATDGTGGIELSARRYRYLDRASKLLGLGLVAFGLDVGGDTLGGVMFGVVGAAIALTTVFVRRVE